MKPFLLRGIESDNTYFCGQDVCVSLADCLVISGAMCGAASEDRHDQERECAANFAVYLKNMKNVTIDFQGHTLFLKGEIQPFFLENCENIKIRNCIVEYDRGFATEFEVLESTPTRLRGRLSKKTPCRVENGNLIPYSDTWANTTLHKSICFLQAFNKITRRGEGLSLVTIGNTPNIDESLPWSSSTYRLRAETEGDDLILTDNGMGVPSFPIGSIAALGHSARRYSTIYAISCKDLYIENFRIINGSGMGIFLQHTENIYMDGLKMTYDERSHGLISNEADGIHAVACAGDFILKNSVIEGTLDDVLNIHGNYDQFLNGTGNRITVRSGGSASSDFRTFDVGDQICIYEGNTLQGGKKYIIQDIRKLSKRTKEFILNRPAEAHKEGDIIENLSAQPHIYINNCKFGKTNTHARFQSRGGITVTNSETELPFLLTGDMNFWFESSPVTAMTIDNTSFTTHRARVECIPEFTATEQTPFYHGELTIRNCTFASEQPVYAIRSEKIRFMQNRNENGTPMRLHLTACGEAISDCAALDRENPHT